MRLDDGRAPLEKTAPRRRLDPTVRRAQILEEMLRLCANQHFASISMRQLAAACDVNMALLYHYFDSKQGLVRAALRHAIDDFLVEFDDLPKDVDAP
ncbi:unnamed protein product, partial [Ectocarpus sp. 12 AP-2014]